MRSTVKVPSAVCPTCGESIYDDGIADDLLAIVGDNVLSVRCPGCSMEIELSARDPEPDDPDVADDDPLAPWYRDRARGIPTDRLPRYDHDRATWTVYGEDVESYAAATARMDNVKLGLTPDGSRIAGWLDYFLDPDGPDIPDSRLAEPLQLGRAIASAWGVDVDRFIAA